jgi:hypothetical protein
VGEEPVVRVGARGTETEETTFGTIQYVVVLSDGRMVAADPMLRQLRVYGPDGSYLNALGGPGEGPGEFERLDRIAGIVGDSVAVRDVGAFDGKTIVYAADGSGYRTVRGPPMVWSGLSGVFVAGWQADGTALVSHTTQTDELAPGLGVDSVAWHRFSPTSEHVGLVAVLPRTRNRNVGPGAGPLVFTWPARIATTETGFWHGFTESVELVHHGPSGVDRIIRTTFEPAEVPPDIVDDYREWYAEVQREVSTRYPPELQSLVEARIEELAFSERFPAFRRLVVADDGHLWLLEYPTVDQMRAPEWEWPFGDGAVQRWTVLAPDGRWLGSVTLPDRVSLRAVHADRIIGVHTDSHDVPSLVVHEIERPR